MHLSMKCDELFNPMLGPDIEDILSEAGVPEPITTYAKGRHEQIVGACELWPRRVSNGALPDPVDSAIPTLLSSGEFDPITPPAFATLAAASLTEATQVVFANSGHGAITESECSQNLLISYLLDPQAPLDLQCSSEIELQFVTSQQEFLGQTKPEDLVVPRRFGL